jgi:processing peptidase subunit beta
MFRRAVVATRQVLARANSQLTTTKNPNIYALNPTGDYSQFTKANLVAHGELEDGVIPEALKYTRPTKQTTLANGVQVITEAWDSPGAHLAVYVKVGVRNESFALNGINHFVTQLKLRGTGTRSALQLATQLEDSGSRLSAHADREATVFEVSTLKDSVNSAFEILADVATNKQFSKGVVEEQRQAIAQTIRTNDPKAIVVDNLFYTSFRDHMISQPIKGNDQSLQRIKLEDIQRHLADHYVGSRIVVVGTGNVTHQQVADLAQQHFSNLPATGGEVKGEDTPLFTGSQLQIRDDDVDMTHVGIGVLAPGWNQEDFFAFQLLQRLMGEYIPERDSVINHPHLQYNYIHRYFGEMEDFGGHQARYFPLSDVGLFTNYAFTMDLGSIWLPRAILTTQKHYTKYVMESEMYRARNRLYNDLLTTESRQAVAQQIGLQQLFAHRRIPRSEIAKRVSVMDPRYLESVFSKWLWDIELGLSFYGPTFFVARNYGIFRSYTCDRQWPA